MAYNLRPLIQILEHILYPHQNHRPHWVLDPEKNSLIESLLTKASFLNDLFENPSLLVNSSHDVVSLESRIRDAALHAQSVIEHHLADTAYKKITISPPYSLQVIDDLEFEPVLDKLVNIMDGRDTRTGPVSSDLVSSSEDLNPKNIIVGMSDDVNQLKEKLFTQKSKLEIIPIVGMGGIGKTTLARKLYEDESVVLRFDIRAWIVISQSYTEREILSGLLKCITGNQDDNTDPGLQMYKKLWNRRYLIVLDDMWNCDAWDSIKSYFPENNERSRILVTTREQDVAHSVASSKHLHHYMKLLNESESWKLLRQKISSKGGCGLQLEDIGKNIAKDCSGLPLAIHVVGGVLSSLDPTDEEAWKRVAKDISSTNDGQISKVLSLSYNHLPNHLKPCFLYLGAFPEDCQIQCSRLIKLWMAEGFLRPILGMSFEDATKVYLNQLVERNLLSVGRQETKRNVKSYIMHDLVRELCISKAKEEKFLYGVIDAINSLNSAEVLKLRLRVGASYDQVTQIIKPRGIPFIADVCSLLLFGNTGVPAGELLRLREYAFGLRLLKVLDMLEVKVFECPKEIRRLINLRYLAICISNLHSSSISNLCNLQTLIFHLKQRDSFVGDVKDILAMPQLRHVKFEGYGYPLLVLGDGESLDFVNEELQTLSTVAAGDGFEKVLKATPNLKKLGIDFASVPPHSSTIDLSCLCQLQVLKCSRLYPRWSVSLIFPPSLQKLTLYDFNISNGFLNEIGGLPNLQVFKVKHCPLSEDSMGVWEATEGEFKELRLLVLESFSNLKKWIVDETHYPKLEHLMIYECNELEEIPSVIGYIPTLEIIEVRKSGFFVEYSARKIQEEQIEYGNDALQVLISESQELVRIAAAVEEAKTTLREAEATLTEAIMDFYGDMVVSNRVLNAEEGTLGEATTILQALMVGKREATVEVEVAMAQLVKARTALSHEKTEAQGMYACYEAVMEVNAIERVIAVVVGVTFRQVLITLRRAMVTKREAKADIVAKAEAALAEGEKILAELTVAYMVKEVQAELAEDYPMERLVLINVAENKKRLPGLTEAKTKVAKANAALVEAEKTWMKSIVAEAEETLAKVVEEALRAEKEARAEKEKEAGKPKWALLRTTTAVMAKTNKAKLEKATVNTMVRANTTAMRANATEIEVHTILSEAATAMREAYEAEQITIEKMKEAKEKEHKVVMVGIKATEVEVKAALLEASTAVAKTNKALEMSRAKAEEAYTAVAKAMKALEMARAKAGESSTAVEKGKKALKMARAKQVEIATVAVGDYFHGVLKATPNLKKLGIDIASMPSSTAKIDLSSLCQLQVLKCSGLSRWNVKLIFPSPLQKLTWRDYWVNLIFPPPLQKLTRWDYWVNRIFPPRLKNFMSFDYWRSVNLIVPPSLQKLTLHDVCISERFVKEISYLPNLQVFKAKHCHLPKFSRGVWCVTEVEFKKLRLLLLESFSNFKKWKVDKMLYPKLQSLMIYDCNDLEEIPSEIGYIPTIEKIEVRNSSNSVQESARKIQVEQAERGNDTLQVLIISEPKVEEITNIIGYIPTLEFEVRSNSSISVENSARKIQEEQIEEGNDDTLHVLIGNIFEYGIERE